MQLRVLGSLEVNVEVAQTVDNYPDKPPPLKDNDRLTKMNHYAIESYTWSIETTL